jgi:hypothetical protein
MAGYEAGYLIGIVVLIEVNTYVRGVLRLIYTGILYFLILL